MFNRNRFNRMAFNRSMSYDIMVSINLNGEGGITSKTTVEFNSKTNLDGEGTLAANGTRELFFSVQLDGETSMDPVWMTREIFYKAVMNVLGSMTAKSKKYHVDKIIFSGDFQPGDKIVMDSKNLTVTKNGINSLQYVSGDLIDLVLGQNSLKYSDAESGRTVQLQITHRDKFV
ncbi:hypothetical protein GC096_03885 [Paenibacillus sp. LMG 31461]|uniref:Siphovirus-type tail component C-terminal domain-containing protein n=1 Tax=Paenibacillus plantarum TaxID=2654975 RepID=A0ABX1X4M0_9BACL|nr:hypothetical protein [Paenibacillus plantarum]NOU63186.1 hypothetical protein [Paenibacillus plantarum]